MRDIYYPSISDKLLSSRSGVSQRAAQAASIIGTGLSHYDVFESRVTQVAQAAKPGFVLLGRLLCLFSRGAGTARGTSVSVPGRCCFWPPEAMLKERMVIPARRQSGERSGRDDSESLQPSLRLSAYLGVSRNDMESI